jgi:hypothetical protein
VTASIATTEPSNFAAGETVEWTKVVTDYPSTDGWSLVYSIRGISVFPDVLATPVSDGSYSIAIPAASTAIMESGSYLWSSHAYKAGPPILRYAVGKGVIYVTANLVTAETIESHAAIMVRLLTALLQGRADSDMQRYQVAGRSIDKIPVLEAKALLNVYKAELWKERHPGRANPTVGVAFVRPS